MSATEGSVDRGGDASQGPAHQPPCRFCGERLQATFVDLGMSPLCQTHIAPEQLNQMEPFYPLHAYVCDQCFLVQLEELVAPWGGRSVVPIPAVRVI